MYLYMKKRVSERVSERVVERVSERVIERVSEREKNRVSLNFNILSHFKAITLTL